MSTHHRCAPDQLHGICAPGGALNTLNDAELLQQFKAVEQMDDDDKKTIKRLIDAFITKRKIQQLAL